MLQTENAYPKYLNGQMKIEIPAERRPGNGKPRMAERAKGNNLKNVDVEFPFGKTHLCHRVSGSGKSTLINDTLQPSCQQHFYRSLQDPLPYDSVEGLDYIDKVVNVDQSPLGRHRVQSGHLYRVFRYPESVCRSARSEDPWL